MRRTYRTLNDCEMQHNAEVGLFTRPSDLHPRPAPPELRLQQVEIIVMVQ